MENKAGHVQQLFSAIADHYDFLNTLLSFNRDKYWRRFAVSKSELKAKGLALDVATGTGELALELARRVNGEGEVIGVDFCERMLSKARDKVKRTKYDGRIEFVEAQAESLPFPDNLFDCATISFALRNVSDIKMVLEEMRRVVRPGGKLISLELVPPAGGIVKRVYYFYMFHIAPFLGGLISGKRKDYVYLPDSIVKFASPLALKQLMEEAGWKGVQIYPLTFGIVNAHVGTKGAA